MTPARADKDTFISSLRKLGYRVERNENGTAFIFKEGFWGWIEFKKTKNSKKRPGQQENVDWASQNSYGTFCYPENKKEILDYLRSIAK